MDFAQLVKPQQTAPPPEDGDFESRVNKFITEKWQDLKSAYVIYHSWIWEALLMYAGNLWLRWNGARRSYEFDEPEDSFTPRPRINRFTPAMDAIASVFQVIPEVEAVATPKDDIKKIGIAGVCNILSDHFIKDCGLRSDFGTEEDKVSIAAQWFTLAGCFGTNVFVEEVAAGERPVTAPQPAVNMQCLTCDTNIVSPPEEAAASGGICPQCGQPMEQTPTEQMLPQQNEDGSPMMEPMTEKHVRCEIEDPKAFYPSAGAKTMKDAGFLIMADRRSLDRIWSELGIEDAAADSEFPDGWNTVSENALNFFMVGYQNSTLIGKDAAMVIRLYLEPNKVKAFPEGVFAVYIGGKCKHVEPWPFGDAHPITKADHKPIPTLFFARTPAFDITGVMREFLDYSSLIKLHGFTTAVDPWIVDDSTNPGEITGRGDKEIHWNSHGQAGQGREPHHAGAGSLDNGIYEMRKLVLEDIDQIAQTVAVWRGETPEGVKSGVAIDSLRTQASAMFAGPGKNFSNAWKETVRKGVMLYQQHYTIEQLSRICGDNRLEEISDFKQCDLNKDIEWIATQQGMPRTQEELRQEMMDLFDRGMLDVNDPSVREKAFKLFGETGMLGTFNEDATRARYENAIIKQGGAPIFMPEVDDNAVHLQIHGDQIKGMDFLGWPTLAKEAMLAHYLETKQVVGAEQMQQAVAMAPKPQVPPARPGQPAARPPQPQGATQ